MVSRFSFRKHIERANRNHDRAALLVGRERSSVMNANPSAIIVKDLADIYVMATTRLLMLCHQFMLAVPELYRLRLDQQLDPAIQMLKVQ